MRYRFCKYKREMNKKNKNRGNKNRKFMTKKFKNELLKTSKYSMKTQYYELNRMFSEWKNNDEQTDDVLIIGIQL